MENTPSSSPSKRIGLPVIIYPSNSYNSPRAMQRNDLNLNQAISPMNVRRTVHVEECNNLRNITNTIQRDIPNVSMMHSKNEKCKAFATRLSTGIENESFRILNSKNTRIIGQSNSKFPNFKKIEKVTLQNAKFVSLSCLKNKRNGFKYCLTNATKMVMNCDTNLQLKNLKHTNNLSNHDVLNISVVDEIPKKAFVEFKALEEKQVPDVHSSNPQEMHSNLFENTSALYLPSIAAKLFPQDHGLEYGCTLLEEDHLLMNMNDYLNFEPPNYPAYLDEYGLNYCFAFSNEDKIRYDPNKVIIKNDVSFRGLLERNDIKAFYYSNKIEAVLGKKNITLPPDFSSALLSLQSANFLPEPNERVKHHYEFDLLWLINQNILTLTERRLLLEHMTESFFR